MTFGTAARALRQQRGLSLRDVASDIGIHFTHLSKLERGRETPGEETVRALAALLDADAEELLALAGKIPAELQQRALADWRFAALLRRLPTMTDEELAPLYRLVGVT